MIQQPHFRNHAEQQAALGCAAFLDPVKYPRRHALEEQRKRMKRGVSVHEQYAKRREELLPRLIEAAKTMTITQAEKSLGISRGLLKRMADDNGIAFVGRYESSQKQLGQLARQYLAE